MSGPHASRTAPTMATARSISSRVRLRWAFPNGSHLTALMPRAFTFFAASAKSCGSRAPTNQAFAYIGTLSRTFPPRSVDTGTLKNLPAMSHSASSMPARALIITGPPFQ